LAVRSGIVLVVDSTVSISTLEKFRLWENVSDIAGNMRFL